jgi:hypothetical protein
LLFVNFSRNFLIFFSKVNRRKNFRRNTDPAQKLPCSGVQASGLVVLW